MIKHRIVKIKISAKRILLFTLIIMIFGSTFVNVFNYQSKAVIEYSDILSYEALNGEISTPEIISTVNEINRTISVVSEVYASNKKQDYYSDLPDAVNVFIEHNYIEKVTSLLKLRGDNLDDKKVSLRTSEVLVSNINYVISVKDIENLSKVAKTLEITNKNCSASVEITELLRDLEKNKSQKLIITISKKYEEDESLIKNLVNQKNTNLDFYGEMYDIYFYSVLGDKATLITDVYTDIAIKLKNIKEGMKRKITSALVNPEGEIFYTGGKVIGDTFNFKKNRLFTFIILIKNIEFKDISESASKNEIEILSARGIFDNIISQDNLFKPQKLITRGEFAKIVATIFAIKENEYQEIYDDVKEKDKYSSVLEGLKQASLMKGYGNNFGGKDLLTREQMATFALNAYKYSNVDVFTIKNDFKFKDEDKIFKFAKISVLVTLEKGILEYLKDGFFGPKNGITREETAKALYKIMNNLELF